MNSPEEKIFSIRNNSDFSESALDIFKLQSAGNKVYSEFLTSLRIDPASVKTPDKIPFLPVEFFKTRSVITGDRIPSRIFESSGTTGNETSRHYVKDLTVYERSFLSSFTLFYGDPADYMIAALLPSYTERENSSLVYMTENLIRRSAQNGSGFYREDIKGMMRSIESARKNNLKVLLLGVSFALLDLAEKYSPDLHDVIVMETGGMKGRRKEMTRDEFHVILKKAFNADSIHSEYGMTELLSQAYSKANGIFRCPPWMKILIRDPQDPLTIYDTPGITGGINIIDLANIHSCAFLATGDLGRLYEDGTFEVLGRMDIADIRGCNLLIE